ncbi:class I SAM-dependent methyltransferase [Nocardioides zeae]|uniref:class I SAM-dependent methyltransferase n=1 Tax=Nocardioides zeae TaxID=1457234 RepID=UPI0019D5526E|nr:class I SAM-dependent methyltransferase [Nocardioides zeae]
MSSSRPDQPADAEAHRDASFDDVWATAQHFTGWLTEAQARLLHAEALAAPGTTDALEIGSHQGRSTAVLAHARRARGGRLVALDPFVDGRLFGGAATRTIFEKNMATAGVRDVIDLRVAYSTKERASWSTPLSLLYVDGKHDYWTAGDDLMWAVHLPEGGAVLVHDCYSSIGVTLAILRHVLFSRTLRYERRAGSLALFRVGRPSLADRGRVLAEMPWWIRNVGIKVLLRLRLRPVARLVGHDSPYDPY